MEKTWHTPSGNYYTHIREMLDEPHLLIAGATGSGKSVLVNTLIYTALLDAPCQRQFILIDPKSVELMDYEKLPHTIRYADELNDIVRALEDACSLMDRRFKYMKENHLKKFDGSDVYVIIDEWVDLKFQLGKKAETPMIRLASKARASKIHLILCTQRPTRDVIDGAIRANFTSKVCLRTDSRQESYNVLERGGAELLPKYGEGIYKATSEKPVIVDIPMTSEEDIRYRVEWWMRQK